MEFKKRISWRALGLILAIICHNIDSSQSFFLPRFLRARQAPVQPPLSLARGQQVIDSEHNHQSSVRGVIRPRAVSNVDSPLPNQGDFHVPKALCLACEKFPWTPVNGGADNGQNGQGSQPPPSPTGTAAGDQLEPQASQQPAPQQFRVQILQEPYDPSQKPKQSTSEGGKDEPRGTLVISALNNQGNRKPYALQFDSSKSENSLQQPKQQQQPPQQQQQRPQQQQEPQQQQQRPQQQQQRQQRPLQQQQQRPQQQQQQQTFGGSSSYSTPLYNQPPYDPRKPTLLKPAPNNAPLKSAESINSQVVNQSPLNFQSRPTEYQKPQGIQGQATLNSNYQVRPEQPQASYGRPIIQNYLPFPPRQNQGGNAPTLLLPVKNPPPHPPSTNYSPNSQSIIHYKPIQPQNNYQPQNNQQNIYQPPSIPQPPPSYQPQANYQTVSSQNFPQPNAQKFPHKIAPITVGTIVAAQHNIRIHDIQPAKLVYQEHTHIHPPSYMSPPSRPTQQSYTPNAPSKYTPAAPSYGKPQQQTYAGPIQLSSSPQSFKVPIIPTNSFGAFTINQIPVESVPNHGKGQYGGQPPQQSYGGSPPPTYGPPKPPTQGYGPPKPPAQGYGPPRQPQNNYGPPPQQNYGPSQPPTPQTYEPPKPQNYGPPPSAPQGQYGSPQPKPPQIHVNNQPPPQIHVNNQPPPQLPQRPIPPQRPYRPPRPNYAVQEPAPFPSLEMKPPAPPAAPEFIQYDENPYRNQQQQQQIFQHSPSQGQGQQVLFPRPSATLQFGPAQGHQVPTLSAEIQQNFGPPPEVHIQVNNEPVSQPLPITIPNVLQGQALYSTPKEGPPSSSAPDQQSGDEVNVSEFQRSKYNAEQQFVNQQVGLGQDSSVKGSENKERGVSPDGGPIPASHPIPAPPSDTKEAEQQQLSYVKNPHIQSIDQGQSQDSKGSSQDERELEESAAPPTVGAWEIVPAHQYEITHLFKNKGNGNNNEQTQTIESTQQTPSSSAQESEQRQPQPQQIPIPVPVPIPESHLTHSKSPLFIVSNHPIPTPSAEENSNHLLDVDAPRQPQTQHFVLQSNYNLPPPEESQGFDPQPQQEFRYQTQYDPLPPSIVSALQHAQRTSFLTHQHLTPTDDSQGQAGNGPTVYVNSVTVSEAPAEAPRGNYQEEYIPTHQPQPSAPAAPQSHFRAVLESSIIDESGNRVKTVKEVPVYSARPFIPGPDPTQSLGEEGAASGDHLVANCNSSPHWVIPVNHPNAQQVPEESQANGEVRKPYLYYYPAPLSSVYWVEQPQRQLASDSGSGHQDPKGQGFGQKLKPIYVPPTPFESTDTTKTVYSKPWFQWSKVIHPVAGSGKSNSAASSIENSNEEKEIISNSGKLLQTTTAPYDILAFGRQPVESYNSQGLDESVESERGSTTGYSLLEQGPQQLFIGTDVSGNSKGSINPPSSAPQSFRVPVLPGESNGVEESPSPQPAAARSKSPKFVVDDSYPVGLEAEGTSGKSYEVVGPTAGVECTSEATTETGIPTSFTTDSYSDDFTVSSLPTTTFSPSRLLSSGNGERIKLRVGARFPSGRPGVSSAVSDSSDSSVRDSSASIQVPVYRPRGGSRSSSSSGLLPSNKLTLEDIYKSSEMKQLGQESSATTSTEQSVSVSVSSSEEESVTLGARKFIPSRRITETTTGATESTTDSSTGPTTQKNDPTTTTGTESSTVFGTTEPGEMTSTPGMSTKVVKTVRVRQRMRTGGSGSFRNGSSGPLRTRLGGPGGPSRIRVVQRPVTPDYSKHFPEFPAAEADLLGEEEQKEVKNALIEIKKIN